MLKVMTVVGTRPELIRLSRTIAELDRFTEHIFVHTGQNYDPQLNDVFYADLGLRRPDVVMDLDPSSLASVLGGVLDGTERALLRHRPDALVVLGDTNSALAALMARRHQVPVYHLEAGNRSFDDNVPEEVNRRLVDHIADYNLAYTEHARRNLLAEGLSAERTIVTGSPMREVLAHQSAAIAASRVLETLGLRAGHYFLVSLHREENVDEPDRLHSLLAGLSELSAEHGLPVLMSTHPRTRRRLADLDSDPFPELRAHPPFGFSDYLALQRQARCVLSDSGTISEESAILGFAAVTLRPRIERPESIETGGIITAGVTPEGIRAAVRLVLADRVLADSAAGQIPSEHQIPSDYQVSDFSRRVVRFIASTAPGYHQTRGVRRRSPVWSGR
jgi:UDP-N-acetylglucosamine 2-epimerase